MIWMFDSSAYIVTTDKLHPLISLIADNVFEIHSHFPVLQIRQQKDVYNRNSFQFLSAYIWVYCGYGPQKAGIRRLVLTFFFQFS